MTDILYRFRYLFWLIPVLAIVPFAKSSLQNTEICKVEYDNPKSFSVQRNTEIYNEIFGNESCSPNQLVLRLPVNAEINNDLGDSTVTSDYLPKISTVLVTSNESENFEIKRIDRSKKNKYLLSTKHTCLSWYWSRNEEQEEQVLNLSMERNLEINNKEAKEIIFVLLLPIELQSKNTKIILNRFVKENKSEGLLSKFNLRDFPYTREILKTSSEEEVDELSKEMSKELEEISGKGGIYFERDYDGLIQGKYKKAYKNNPDSSNCAIPIDWK